MLSLMVSLVTELPLGCLRVPNQEGEVRCVTAASTQASFFKLQQALYYSTTRHHAKVGPSAGARVHSRTYARKSTA